MKKQILEFRVVERDSFGDSNVRETLYSGSEWAGLMSEIIKECLMGCSDNNKIYEFIQLDNDNVFLTIINKNNKVEVFKDEEYEF